MEKLGGVLVVGAGPVGFITALRLARAGIHGKSDESILDFYEEEHRRVFLEFSSPAATEYKRLLSEKDPEQQRQDRENLQRVAADPGIMRQTMLAIFRTRGQPMLQ